MSLFRQQAIDYQRRRLWGDVILTQSLSSWAIIILVAGILTALGLFLWSQDYKRKESVTGYLVPNTGLSRYFADQGGRVAALHIKSGEAVQKGQILGYIKSDKANEAGAPSTQTLIASVTRDIDNLDALQKALGIRKSAERQLLEARLQSQQQQLAVLAEEITVLQKRIGLAEEGVVAIEVLAQKGNAPRALINERKQSLLSFQQALITTRRQKTSAEENLSILASDMETFDIKADEERLTLSSRREGLLQQLANMQVSAGFSLVAPANGIVDGVFVREGQALRPGQALLTIRPEGSTLQAHLLVPSRSAGLIKSGQQARIQYDAFPYQRFGIFSGTVSEISNGIISPGELPIPVQVEESFYLVTLALDTQSVSVAGSPVALKSGMQLQADITLETRTLLQWVLDPILSLKGRL